MLGDLKTYLAKEMSQNNILTHGKLQRCQTQRSDMQELKFAIALINGPTLL